ncbi:hypothetical protein [Actinoplanes sp. NPDC051494]|uniref:hypothetical protein n=1 Tax=Actinoplanes sp. NPDC051494 TaxID=3363907 RepID=UPI0037975406
MIGEGAEQMIRRDLPFHSVEESDDGRWYIIDGVRFMSVTTALNALDKRGLVPWAGGLAAELSFLELPTLVAASRKKPCERTWNRCKHDDNETCERCPCRVCRLCVQKWVGDRHKRETARRSDEGVRVHDVAEWWSYHGEIKDHDADIALYIKSFGQFVDDYGITPEDVLLAEAILVNREVGAAGQTDGIIRFHAERSEAAAKLISRILAARGERVSWRKAQKLKLTVDLIIDYKSRENDEAKFYPENALQLAGYRHFPVIRVKNSDVEIPMLPVDGGLVIQLRPDGYSTRLVVCDRFTYEHGFLPALRTYQWVTEHGAAAVSSHTFVLPETLAARERQAAKDRAGAEQSPAEAA